jgi:hypothetical protein
MSEQSFGPGDHGFDGRDRVTRRGRPGDWGYALAWFLVNDRVKLLAYRIFDPTAAPLLAWSTSP